MFISRNTSKEDLFNFLESEGIEVKYIDLNTFDGGLKPKTVLDKVNKHTMKHRAGKRFPGTFLNRRTYNRKGLVSDEGANFRGGNEA